MRPIFEKYLPLAQSSSHSPSLHNERRKDHYAHFILRLAFSATEDLRRRYSRLETQLFRMRFLNNDVRDRQEFVESLNFEWEKVSDEERRELASELLAATPGMKRAEDEGWFKVDWEKVPELIETRKVLLRRGKAYVPAREQLSMVVSEFTKRLEQALEVSTIHVNWCVGLTPSTSSQLGHFLVLMKMIDYRQSCKTYLAALLLPGQPTTNPNKFLEHKYHTPTSMPYLSTFHSV